MTPDPAEAEAAEAAEAARIPAAPAAATAAEAENSELQFRIGNGNRLQYVVEIKEEKYGFN